MDRINEDYYDFSKLGGAKKFNSYAVESIAFHVFMAARSIWEELRCQRAYERSGRNSAAAMGVHKLSIPQFIVNVAKQAKQHLK